MHHVASTFSIDLLDNVIEIDGKSKSIIQHITEYIKELKPIAKINLISTGILSDVQINNETLEFESVNVICEELIINKLLM